MSAPLVGMEPSCVAVFKHELIKMLPHDLDAMRVHQNSYHWAEFFEKDNVSVPKLDAKAVVWGHCHHKATSGMTPEMKLLREGMGVDAEEAKGGCCGLAGSWGFEAGKQDISMQCGEIGLLPAVRQAERSTAIVANGFSCKTQLEQSGVGRHALHLGELMRIAQKLGRATNAWRVSRGTARGQTCGTSFAKADSDCGDGGPHRCCCGHSDRCHL